ncbi:hypothetical protein U1737_13600 [Sphingomonas sp. LB3N6]|uniref:hypothetical protein n=1 Tax=Sphingomonas fucosidasi TaxID=3096164 RepID=UPI002FCBE726
MTFVSMLIAIQALDPSILDFGMRPPRSEEARAAETRARKQVPTIARVCQNALQSGDQDKYIRSFADRNGLSSYGRVRLATDCLLYQQGVADGSRRAKP